MYDFGFYLEHSACFGEYLKKELSNGNFIRDFKDFGAIMTKVKSDPTLSQYLNSITPQRNGNIIIAFGIAFQKICDVNLKNTKLSTNDRFYDGDHYDFTKATTAAANGKGVGVYIWRIGKQYRYVGETSNLEKRINQYSNITQTMVDKNYRPTNRRVNAAICNAIKEHNENVTLYFYPTQNHRHDIEQYLLQFKSKSVFNLNEKV